MGAGGEVELVHGLFEVAAGCLIQLAAGLELAGAHGCIRGCGGGAKALTLDVACGLDAGADDGRAFAAVASSLQFLEGDGGHFHMNVDTIQEGATDAVAVVFNFAR